LTEAINSYKKAVEIAQKNGDENLEVFKKNLEEAKKLL
jgi:hypothetical protein